MSNRFRKGDGKSRTIETTWKNSANPSVLAKLFSPRTFQYGRVMSVCVCVWVWCASHWRVNNKYSFTHFTGFAPIFLSRPNKDFIAVSIAQCSLLTCNPKAFPLHSLHFYCTLELPSILLRYSTALPSLSTLMLSVSVNLAGALLRSTHHTSRTIIAPATAHTQTHPKWTRIPWYYNGVTSSLHWLNECSQECALIQNHFNTE